MFTFNKASVFSIKRDPKDGLRSSFLPSFAKLGLDTLSTSVRVFFSPFFLSFKSFGVFGGWSLTALLKRHKARARESPREREKGVLRKKRRRRSQMTDVASTSSLNAMLNNTSSNSNSNNSKKKVVPVRQYLDESVVPCLREAMKELVKVRPEDPHEFLAKYLMKHNPNQQQQHQQQQQQTTTTGQKIEQHFREQQRERESGGEEQR